MFAAGTVGSLSGTNFGRAGGGGYKSSRGTATITVNGEGSGTVNSSLNSVDATNIWGGAGGGAYYNDGCTSYSFTAGFAVYGGAGGGPSDGTLTGGSSLRGGNGGAGNNSNAAATSGSAPGGGGGASRSGYNSGAGGRGEATITVFPA
jgi:hypothetical protein